MTTQETQLKDLNQNQLDLYTRLKRLGDDHKLALKTALEYTPQESNEMYELAYYS